MLEAEPFTPPRPLPARDPIIIPCWVGVGSGRAGRVSAHALQCCDSPLRNPPGLAAPAPPHAHRTLTTGAAAAARPAPLTRLRRVGAAGAARPQNPEITNKQTGISQRVGLPRLSRLVPSGAEAGDEWDLAELSPEAEPLAEDGHGDEGEEVEDPPVEGGGEAAVGGAEEEVEEVEGGGEVEALLGALDDEAEVARAVGVGGEERVGGRGGCVRRRWVMEIGSGSGD